MKRWSLALCLSSALLSSSALGAFCDYVPSSMIGEFGSGAVAGTAGATAAAGAGMKAAGFYTLVHSVTGATMLGSAAGGASAAGTVGIMGGTAGAVGSAAAALMAPAVIGTAAVIAVGVTAYEGGCYFYEKDQKKPLAAPPVANKNKPAAAK